MSDRWDWLRDELRASEPDGKDPSHNVSDDDVRYLLADRDALAERCEKLRAALATHVVAVDDWLNTFAPEHCAEARVKEAQDRIWESGGTLSYIAGLQAAARGALAEGCLAAPKDAP